MKVITDPRELADWIVEMTSKGYVVTASQSPRKEQKRGSKKRS